jgi:hypothetical protein
MRSLAVTLLLFVAACTLSPGANAFTVKSTKAGVPVHWKTGSLRVVVDGSLKQIDGDAEGAVSRAMATWKAVRGAFAPDVVLEEGTADEIGFRPGSDNINTIRFAPHGSEIAGTALSVTIVTFDPIGTILDADIVINGGKERSFAAPRGPQQAGWTSGEDTKYDLQNVATHEIGHFFGLSHNNADPVVTMFATSACGETKKRDLTIDDEEGLRFLYSRAVTTDSSPGCDASGAAPWSGAGSSGLGAAAFGLGLGAVRAARRARRRLLAAAAAATAVALAASLAPAMNAAPRPKGPSERAGDSAREGTARVVAAAPRWESGLVVTELVLEIGCAAAACPDDRISVEVLGGMKDGVAQIVGDEAVPELGEELPVRWSAGALIWPQRFPMRRAGVSARAEWSRR